MITSSTTLADVAGAVAAALRKVGYDPVVVGGSASTLHAPAAYRSLDVDMVVVEGIDDPRLLTRAMESIGFSLAANHTFCHADSPYTVDFVPEPVAVANDIVAEFALLDTAFGPVRVLHAADAVCDRLNKYIAWSDRDALDAAVAVARSCNVEVARIQAFVARHAVGSDRGAFEAGFAVFLSALTPANRRISPFYFTTCAHLRLAPTSRRAPKQIMVDIQRLLDSERSAIDGLNAVRVAGDLSVTGHDAVITLSLHTSTDVPIADRLRIAIDVLNYLRSRLPDFPDVVDVIDDDSPPIAHVGP